MLAYEDAGAAIEWLARPSASRRSPTSVTPTTTERSRTPSSARRERDLPRDAEQGVREPAAPSPDLRSRRRWLDNPWVIDGVYVGVDDLDGTSSGTRCRRDDSPFAGGPGIGQRIYSAEDLEGTAGCSARPREPQRARHAPRARPVPRGARRSSATSPARVAAGELPDTVLLLEHPPVITLGRRTEPRRAARARRAPTSRSARRTAAASPRTTGRASSSATRSST